MDPFAVFSGVLVILTVVSIVASAVAVARATLSKSTIETLQQSNAALVERVGLLELENARLAAKLTSITAENTSLQTYVNGTEAVRELAKNLASADITRALEHHDMLAAIQSIPTIVSTGHDEMMALINAVAHTHPKPGVTE